MLLKSYFCFIFLFEIFIFSPKFLFVFVFPILLLFFWCFPFWRSGGRAGAVKYMNGRADFDKSLVVFLTVYTYQRTYRILYRGEWWTSLQPSCPAPFHTIWYSHAGDSGYITSLSLRRPRSIRFDRSVCNKWMDVSWLPPFLFFLLLFYLSFSPRCC